MERLFALAALVVLSGAAPARADDGVAPGLVDNLVSQTENLRPEILELAFRGLRRGARGRAYFSRQRLTVIDYSLPSYEKRLWVIDMATAKVLFEEIVAHGMGSPRGSGGDMETAKDFSNLQGSRKSSLGSLRHRGDLPWSARLHPPARRARGGRQRQRPRAAHRHPQRPLRHRGPGR